MQPAQRLLEAGQVEHVLEALAVGLQHDRELAVALRHLEQRLRLQPLLPSGVRFRAARVGAAAPGGVLAEAREQAE